MPDRGLSQGELRDEYEKLGLMEMGLSYEDWVQTIPETQALVRNLVEAVKNPTRTANDSLTEHIHRTWRESS